jgi:hypothetical protein
VRTAASLEVATLDVGDRLKKDRTQLVVDGHVVVRGKVLQAFRRVDVRLRQDIFRVQPLEQNRVETPLGKREKPLPVFGKGRGKVVLGVVFHAANSTISS